MKRLFVGCRARILYSHGWPSLAGEEGRIVGRSKTPGIRGDSEWLVAPDCWGSYKAPMAGVRGELYFGPHSDQLEPILPDGAGPSKYSYEELIEELQREPVMEEVR